ncbi:hypothetical protein FACS1894208_12990 [Clostridia bacterium]|nr:hypothetical protein FACS1894208_12990 [Clostridia bacterium]
MNNQTHETEQGVIGAMLIDAACIAAVIENTPTAANVMAYAALAREHAILRAAHDATTIEEIEAAARMVAERQTVEVIDMGAASSSLFRELDERCSNGQKIAG